VEQCIGALHRSEQAVFIRDIPRMNLDADRFQRLSLIGAAGKGNHLMPRKPQLARQFSADKPGAAGKEYTHQNLLGQDLFSGVRVAPPGL
jgi:hypothetical protein